MKNRFFSAIPASSVSVAARGGTFSRWLRLSVVLSAGVLVSAAGHAAAQVTDQQKPVAGSKAAGDVTGLSVWKAASENKLDAVLTLSDQLAQASDERGGEQLRLRLGQVKAGIAAREEERAASIKRVAAQIDDLMAAAKTNVEVSKALMRATELHMLELDKNAMLATPRMKSLVERAATAAREAEAQGDWLIAGELFGRLNLLLEETQQFKPDVRRLSDRLTMLRLYAPERLYELRNIRRQQDGMKPLPPFNSIGEDYTSRLTGVDESVVLKAVGFASENHIERVPVQKMVIGGLEAVKVLVTTKDLASVFSGLADVAQRDAMVAVLDAQIARFNAADAPGGPFVVANMLEELRAASARTVKLPDAALLHEFGNGAFDKLDEFSQIVWPDELARFKRMTEGSFVGVGIQIQLDDESHMIKVVSPLEGTPAQKAGIRAGDLLKKINEKTAVGMTLDQAVEQITGGAGSTVRMLIERAGEDVFYELRRARIKLPTVKGWARSGTGEMDWSWFIDDRSQIGYLRISNFSDTTTRDLRKAIGEMKRSGLRGLIFDLRFNPGGLLDQSVSVANLFIDEGPIVWTQGISRRQTETAEPGRASLRNVPTVVLINETSASASEIVSGAIRYYGDKGEVPALVLGNRSYGKGSVQNVVPLSSQAQVKLTTGYYFLPSGVCIHRREGASVWGVEPNLKLEMLPKQQNDSLVLRSDADLTADAERPKPAKKKEGEMSIDDTRYGPPDANRLITENIDLQLQAALLVLEARLSGPAQADSQRVR